LLGALVRCNERTTEHNLIAHLANRLPATRHTDALVRAFLEEPASRRPLELLTGNTGLTPRAVRQALRDLHFERSQYLFTWLRAESWVWLVSRGFDPHAVEPFLGIHDRSNFRRSCRRASVKTPWQAELAG
jgi:hypothetical protein